MTSMGFCADIRQGADRLADSEEVRIISHIDADGIASEAILAETCARAGIPHTTVFIRQLEPLTIGLVPKGPGLTLFTDLGAGQQQLLADSGFSENEVLIVDHHVSQDCDVPYLQVNCLPHGFGKMSAAGVSYFIARELDRANTDLARVAVVGNVGDMMAREDLGLTGPARKIVTDGEMRGDIRVDRKNLNAYGISTRPVHICLAYCDDPFIPGISNNPQNALHFLEGLGVPVRDERGVWLVWESLGKEHQKTVISALIEQLTAHGEPVDRLLAETYTFPGEELKKPVRNAPEFATVLNACGRWERPDIGSAICRGHRGEQFFLAERMLTNHRAVIRDLLQFILESGVTELSHLQFIHVGSRYPDTVVGIGAGMALSRLNWEKPILVMCDLRLEPHVTKISMRTNERMVKRGVDLQQVLTIASGEIGGAGGGHRIAAGAYIPKEREQWFVERVNELLGEQSSAQAPGHC